MKANIHLTVKETHEPEAETKEMQHSAERIWNTMVKYITRHVTVDKDAIFKDPDWPHLWDKKS